MFQSFKLFVVFRSLGVAHKISTWRTLVLLNSKNFSNWAWILFVCKRRRKRNKNLAQEFSVNHTKWIYLNSIFFWLACLLGWLKKGRQVDLKLITFCLFVCLLAQVCLFLLGYVKGEERRQFSGKFVYSLVWRLDQRPNIAWCISFISRSLFSFKLSSSRSGYFELIRWVLVLLLLSWPVSRCVIQTNSFLALASSIVLLGFLEMEPFFWVN